MSVDRNSNTIIPASRGAPQPFKSHRKAVSVKVSIQWCCTPSLQDRATQPEAKEKHVPEAVRKATP